MSALFTSDAVARLQKATDKAELGDLMMRLRDLRGAEDIVRAGGRRLSQLGDITIYFMPVDRFLVVLTITPKRPETVVVTGIYHAGDEVDAIEDAILSTLREVETSAAGSGAK